MLVFNLMGGSSQSYGGARINTTSSYAGITVANPSNGTAKATIPIASMVNNFNPSTDINFIVQGISGNMYSTPKLITIPNASFSVYAGTLYALSTIADWLTPNGGTINNNSNFLVNTINEGSVGTLFTSSGSPPPGGGSILLTFDGADSGTPTVNIRGGSVLAGSVGTEAEYRTAGSFTLGTESVGGTLLITDYGSGGEGDGTVVVYFGTNSTGTGLPPASSNPLILDAVGMLYNIPQFGVVVTVY
jgi:hypothetical protein